MIRPAIHLMSLAMCGVVLQGCAGHQVSLTEQAPATLAAEPSGYEDALVTRVVDGDTIVARISARTEGPGAGSAPVGAEVRVRLIGIDTPESVKPNSPVECFGREASAALKALIEGSEVKLVRDVEEADRYDRLLRYVYLGEEMANARMVANGYASAYTFPPSVRYSEMFVQLEREAREANRGLWSADTCSGDP